jgi:hypothetical protein
MNAFPSRDSLQTKPGNEWTERKERLKKPSNKREGGEGQRKRRKKDGKERQTEKTKKASIFGGDPKSKKTRKEEP